MPQLTERNQLIYYLSHIAQQDCSNIAEMLFCKIATLQKHCKMLQHCSNS